MGERLELRHHPKRAGNTCAAYSRIPRRSPAPRTWPDNPVSLTPGDAVRLESIDFTAPLAAFYRTA